MHALLHSRATAGRCTANHQPRRFPRTPSHAHERYWSLINSPKRDSGPLTRPKHCAESRGCRPERTRRPRRWERAMREAIAASNHEHSAPCTSSERIQLESADAQPCARGRASAPQREPCGSARRRRGDRHGGRDVARTHSQSPWIPQLPHTARRPQPDVQRRRRKPHRRPIHGSAPRGLRARRHSSTYFGA